jgi:hypothetical protein
MQQAQARTRLSPDRVLFTAAALILLLGSQLPVATYLSPRTGLGYAIGIVGGTMILMQLLYALRKRVKSMRFLGTVAGWFQAHMMLGILAVSGSGIFGRYFYSKIHRGLYGRKANLAELQASARDLRERGTKLLMMPKLMEIADEQERRLLAVADWNSALLAFAPLAIALRFSSGRGRLRRYARAAINLTAERHKAVANQRARFERVARDYINRRMRATREVAEFRIYERLFSVWHVLHVPLFLMLIAAGIVHVISVHVY